MPLQLKELRRVAKQVIKEERAIESLREEVARELGPSVITDVPVGEFALNVNEQLDVLECTKKISRVHVNPSVLHALLEHRNADVRKIVARLIPEKYVMKLVDDESSEVRTAVAKRIPLIDLRKMAAKYVDDSVHHVYKNRRLHEADELLGGGEPELHLYDDAPLGDAVKTSSKPELSDTWYEQMARKLMHDYGHDNIEYNWEEVICHRLCSSTKATSGVELDEEKLFKALKKVIADHEEFRLEKHNAMVETVATLRHRAALDEEWIPFPGEEAPDPVRELAESKTAPSEYIEKMNEMFKIRESTIPAAIRKYRIGEGMSKDTSVPMMAYLPHTHGLRSIDEGALDRYVKCWNERQSLNGEPITIDWVPNVTDANKVSFTVSLR